MLTELYSRFRRRRAAATHGVPFEKEDFWPPFYLMCGEYVAPGVRCISKNYALYDAKIGDVVPVMETDGERHFYRLRCWSFAPGSDHIVSPKEFDIEYDHSEPRDAANQSFTSGDEAVSAYEQLSPLERERVDYDAGVTLHAVFDALHAATGWCGDLTNESWLAGIPVMKEAIAKIVISYRASSTKAPPPNQP